MTLRVQDFITANGGVEKLTEAPSFIKIKDYPDRISLNYDQIESPKFDPMVMECRALILWKKDWSVAARSFDRFWNSGEDKDTANFPFDSNSRFEEKVDGSIISLYWDFTNQKWQPASRSCAFAEGETILGNTFANVFWQAINGTNVIPHLKSNEFNNRMTWVFELTSPETRVVTPYTTYKVYLIGCRDNVTGLEMSGKFLDDVAANMGVARPKSYHFKNLQEAMETAQSLPSLEEGFVLVNEKDPNSFWRMKCKNAKYLAIAHMRANGKISPYRILTLIMANDHTEYLSYFADDKPYFDLVELEYNAALNRVLDIWKLHENQPTQKDFALAIIPLCDNSLEKGMLFDLRKGKAWPEIVKGLVPKKVALALDLKGKLQKKFKINLDDDEET